VATRHYGEPDVATLRRWFDGNQDSASEALVAELESTIAAQYGAKRVIATNSCMGALHLALQTIGVGPGDEVLVDPIVVFAGMAAMYQHAKPVFADVDPRTFNVDPASLERRVTARTKAIICTHLFGNLCDMQRIRAVAAAHRLPVVEDCAHVLFTPSQGRLAGQFGDFAAFSFNHRKQLSTGQGGFLLVNSEAYVEASKDKGFGRVPARVSWNYAMPGIVAALALTQWDAAKAYVNKDHELGVLYRHAIAGCPWLTAQHIPDGNWSSYHIWAARFTGDEHGIAYDAFMTALRGNGGDYFLPSFIPYGVFGLRPSPAYRYPLFAEPFGYPEGLCPEAEALVPRLLNTVISPISNERVERYAAALAATVAQFS